VLRSGEQERESHAARYLSATSAFSPRIWAHGLAICQAGCVCTITSGLPELEYLPHPDDCEKRNALTTDGNRPREQYGIGLCGIQTGSENPVQDFGCWRYSALGLSCPDLHCRGESAVFWHANGRETSKVDISNLIPVVA
jgi:hypothetical protein